MPLSKRYLSSKDLGCIGLPSPNESIKDDKDGGAGVAGAVVWWCGFVMSLIWLVKMHIPPVRPSKVMQILMSFFR